jgi:hypothetical protein
VSVARAPLGQGTASDTLLADARSFPVKFQFRLIHLDQSWWYVHFTMLLEEEHEAMSSGPVIAEAIFDPDRGWSVDGPTYDRQTAAVVPSPGWHQEKHGGKCPGQQRCIVSRGLHRTALSRWSWEVCGALALLMGGCSDITGPTGGLLGTDDLLILAMQDEAPQPVSASFWVYNSRQVVRRLVHPDAQLIPFLELTFPAGSLAELNGSPLANNDSTLVTVHPWPGQYGITLSPSGLSFTASAAPTAKFFFGFYADATVADQSSRYATYAEYAAALEIWRETTLALWRVAENSGSAGIDAVSARTVATAEYVLAAPK